MNHPPTDLEELFRVARGSAHAEVDESVALARLHQQIDDGGALIALGELPARTRRAAAVALIVVLGGGMALVLGRRPELYALPPLFGVLVGAAALAFTLTLAVVRSPASALPGGRYVIGWSLAIAIPLCLGAAQAYARGLDYAPAPLLMHSLCFTIGASVSAVTAMGLRLLDPWPRLSAPRACLVAAVGGLVSFVVLGMHCPADEWLHAVVAHGVHGLVGVMVVLAWDRRPRVVAG